MRRTLNETLQAILTPTQIRAINRLTACGNSQKTVLRRLINLGLEREVGGRWIRDLPSREWPENQT